MDLRAYYRKIREVEAGIADAFVLLVSLETPEGGKSGIRTEARRLVAAKQIVEGRARLATTEEIQEFTEENLESKRLADHAATVNRLQVVVVPAKAPARGAKELA